MRYYEIALRSFRRATTYRSAYIAGTLTNAFFGALRSFMYIAIYGAGGSVAGFSVGDAISYSWATQSLMSLAFASRVAASSPRLTYIEPVAWVFATS